MQKLRLLLHDAWTYLDEPVPNDQLRRFEGVTVFLKNPLKGIRYSKGEMRWGIAIQLLLSFYMIYLLLAKAPEYSIPNLVISWWLLLTNASALVTRLILFYHLVSLKTDASQETLRQQMKVIFRKRVYSFNCYITGICLLNYIICLPVVVLIWKYEDKVPDLFIYSLIFMLRYFYSKYRYSKYFMESKDPRNPYNFQEMRYGDEETLISYPKLAERDQCSICLQKYKPNCRLVEFPCSNDHYFHLECTFKWISVSLNCPLCKKTLFKE